MSKSIYEILSSFNIHGACLEVNQIIFGYDGPDGEWIDGEHGVITIDNKDDIIHEEVDDYVNRLKDFEIMCLLYAYGLDDAIKSYKDNYGEVTTSRALVYHLIMEHLPETDGYVNDEDLDE